MEVIEQKLRYPNSAIIGLKFDAKQFTSLPERAYEIKGLVIKIPNNATVRADGSLTYSGTWGGEFQVAWSANPAWIFYDLITNARYGCDLNPLQIDKWGLFAIGQYCDELVPNGYGGTEPRFLINTYIQERADAYEVINSLTSAFRAMTYWQAGLITAVQDAPGTPIRAFNQTNVKDGVFKYSGTAKRSRHTVAIIRWNNPQDFYQSKLEVVEDPSGLRQYGYNETSVVAFGCTSRGQAHRLGKWLLYTEREETETVTFSVGADGIPVRPGDLIKIGDAKRSGVRYYGRIKSASTTAIELDAPVALGAGISYTLGVMLPDNIFQERPVISAPGQQATISVSPAFSTPPSREAVWLINTLETPSKIYRVLSVAEQSSESATEYEITALIHKESKFAAVEQNLNFEEQPLPRQLGRSATSPPRQVSLTSSVQTQSDASNFINLGVSWLYPLYEGTRDVLIASYAAQYKLGQTGNWTGTGETSSQFFEWPGLSEGEYYVRVRAIDISGRPSAWIESTALSVYNKVLLLNSDEVLTLDGGSSLLI